MPLSSIEMLSPAGRSSGWFRSIQELYASGLVPQEVYLKCRLHHWQRGNVVHQEGGAFRAEVENAKWPLRILGEALLCLSPVASNVPALLNVIRADCMGVTRQ